MEIVGPGGLDGAEQGIEVIRARIIDQCVRCFDCDAVSCLDAALFDGAEQVFSCFVLLSGLFGFWDG